jgi:membrane associated rhomboid family serine protease
MGIYDRDYYREDHRWSNPFARSQGTIFLVLLYAFVFIVQMATFKDEGRSATRLLELDCAKVLQGEVWRIGSYALVHHPEYIFHVIFTGFFLVWIGHQIEDLYGTKEFLGFFVLTTLIGGVTYTIVGAFAPGTQVLLGPSGAVTAILVLFALHYPTHRIYFLPIWLVVAIYAFLDVGGMATGAANPAAVAVHLAGAAFAFLYHTYTLRVLNWLPGGRGTGRSVRRVAKPKLRVHRPQPEPEPAAATSSVGNGSKGAGTLSGVDEHLEAKLDEVLAKVARHGKESLTEGERDILLRASEVYKKRRQPG